MATSFQPTETDFHVARTGLTIQAKAHGIDLTDPKMEKFFEYLVEQFATSSAGIRFYTNALNKGVNIE